MSITEEILSKKYQEDVILLEAGHVGWGSSARNAGFCCISPTKLSINQMIKYYKFGFGRVTDYLNLEIREEIISREEAIKIAIKYDGCCDRKYIKDFCNYLQITEKVFNDITYTYVNKKLFKVKKHKNYLKVEPKFKVGEGII